jgi:uncharacterized protein (TIGR02266 family)
MNETNDSDGSGPSAAPRVSARLPARISTIDPETDPFTGKSFFRTCEETSANVSEGGLFVAMRETIPPGRRVLVELELPGGRVIQTPGRVAWTRTKTRAELEPAGSAAIREPGVGIEFVGAHPDDRRALERFLTRSLRRRPPSGQPGATRTPQP